MKILKYIAVGLCVLFTISSGIIKFVEWSGLDKFLSAQVANTTNGGFLFCVFFMGAVCFTAGFDIARAKYEKAALKAEGRDY